MEKQIGPVPAFYACYLLRSIARHSSLYIGSTPNPSRRLSQHNGEKRGGAVRTSRHSLRPWEMACLVTGFPSKIAALQFEWAWQNPNVTRHVAPDSRITQSKMTSRISPKTGRIRKRSIRPRLCLTDRLANLELLLRANSFARWPLKLTFLSEDVHRVWQKIISQATESLKVDVDVTPEESRLKPSAVLGSVDSSMSEKASGVHAFDLSYSKYKDQLQRSGAIFGSNPPTSCIVCGKQTPRTGAATLVCTNANCNTVAHAQCLSSVFLQAEGQESALVPTDGSCPTCHTRLKWVDLVKELSLRMRGEKEMKALFKVRRGEKSAPSAVTDHDAESSSNEDEPLDVAMDDDSDVWHELSESSENEVGTRGVNSTVQSRHTAFKLAKRKKCFPEPIIEDSDWENAEIIT